MALPPQTADVLVVDDRPDKLLGIVALLETLGANVLTATSGREALRHVLRQPFAVILLDINMPGMDGFETAELIRAYRGSKHTPIIFMTAAGDDVHLLRSYALGGVDYILTPVVPDVLRSKVRVFIELFRKTDEVRCQAAALERQASLLRRLTEASIRINSLLSLDGILAAITEAARDLAGAHHATTTVEVPPGHRRGAASYSEKHAALRGRAPDREAGALYAAARPEGGTLRLTQGEIEASPVLARASALGDGPPKRGLLAVPLLMHDGQPMGLVQVSDKQEGELDGDDEAILLQLAQLGSIAIRNCMHAEAREANRMKDEFLATLSHELRTPLHALLGWTRLLRAGPPDPARIARGLEVIERNVTLQTSIIEELLDVSRITAGKLRVDARPIALAPVIEAAVDALRPTADAKSILLGAALDEGGARVLGDADRLHQVISNLVGNALKFTPRGGHVDVILRRGGGEVEILVSDSGMGIGPEFLPYVFDRFRQADSSTTRAQGGLGLGLAVVRHLVELHGGSVSAESPGPGHGATFVVRLPELPAQASAEAPPLRWEAGAAGPESGPRSGVHELDGLRVLVVDDDHDARELLKEVLTQHRAQVTTASSASEALDAIGAERPHVLVSDVAMKGEDGYELVRRLRGRTPEEGGSLPALALTAYARKEDRLRAFAAGFQMHATKPIEPTELVAAVASLARRRTDDDAGTG
jgi:signal transduction histidine kinase/DNA-binding response OmpR family regulator